MYLCICKAVSEKQVEDLLLKGRKNLEEISVECGAGTDCGSCLNRLERKIQTTVATQAGNLASAKESKKD